MCDWTGGLIGVTISSKFSINVQLVISGSQCVLSVVFFPMEITNSIVRAPASNRGQIQEDNRYKCITPN